MKDALLRYATPSMTALFIVSLISGTLIFVHIGPNWLHGVHEWLSMLLFAPFVLHIWKNWRGFVNYFRRAPMPVSLAVSLLAVAAFAMAPSGDAEGRGGPPQFTLAAAMVAATPTAVAPILGVTPDELVARLKEAGFVEADVQTPIKTSATASGKSVNDIYQTMATARR
jgi:hypothetical protein